MRILVAGGPRVDKTTLAAELGRAHGIDPRHTDDLIGSHDWLGAIDAVAGWLDEAEPWVIEGVAVVRALRKWLGEHSGQPSDVVYFSDRPLVALTRGQAVMTKGHATVWSGVVAELHHRDVPVHRF